MNILENLKIKIADLPIHCKSKNALLRDEKYKFKYVGDVVTLNRGCNYVKHLEGYGQTGHKQFSQYLKSLGLKFEMNIPEWSEIKKELDNV